MSGLNEQAVFNAFQRMRSSLKPGEKIRWHSDGQGGGRWFRYRPGVTSCPGCGVTIDKEGECAPGCYTSW